jgi:hypothetical protein
MEVGRTLVLSPSTYKHTLRPTTYKDHTDNDYHDERGLGHNLGPNSPVPLTSKFFELKAASTHRVEQDMQELAGADHCMLLKET